MKPRVILLAAATITLFPVPSADGRVYTSSDGKKIEAEYLTASDTHVTLKLARNGKEYTIPLERLSSSDQEYVTELRAARRKQEEDKAAAEARIAAAEAAAKKVAQFAEENRGKQVGNGECWTLADDAFQAADIKRPGGSVRVWGRELDWAEEKARRGDILELESARFANGARSADHHTAVIIECDRKGVVTVLHQNWGVKRVTSATFDLESMTSGKARIFRYE